MYEPKAVTTTIKATSRVSLKIKDNFFTVEYSEERTIPDIEGVDLEHERELLFEDVNKVVDNQMIEIQETFRK